MYLIIHIVTQNAWRAIVINLAWLGAIILGMLAAAILTVTTVRILRDDVEAK